MAYSIFDASVPVYLQSLKTLDTLLDKLEAHAGEKGITATSLLDAKLAPDMFDFKRQVQIACDHAKGASCRLAGIDIPKHPDTETTVAELRERIARTRVIVESVSREQVAGAEDKEIKLVFPWATYEFTGNRYIQYWSLPNLFFHVTTAYAILRHQGVNVGKMDFLGQ
jgi:hypothetical protein